MINKPTEEARQFVLDYYKSVEGLVNVGDPIDPWAVARLLDAYAAAALTDEQRDVLTVWSYLSKFVGELRYDAARFYVFHADGDTDVYLFSAERNGPDWLHAAAQWCREQGAKGER